MATVNRTSPDVHGGRAFVWEAAAITAWPSPPVAVTHLSPIPTYVPGRAGPGQATAAGGGVAGSCGSVQSCATAATPAGTNGTAAGTGPSVVGRSDNAVT